MSAIISISTQAPIGICATPKALRAWATRAPNNWPMSSLARLIAKMMGGYSPRSGAGVPIDTYPFS